MGTRLSSHGSLKEEVKSGSPGRMEEVCTESLARMPYLSFVEPASSYLVPIMHCKFPPVMPPLWMQSPNLQVILDTGLGPVPGPVPQHWEPEVTEQTDPALWAHSLMREAAGCWPWERLGEQSCD